MVFNYNSIKYLFQNNNLLGSKKDYSVCFWVSNSKIFTIIIVNIRSASSERILKQLERLGPSVAREPVQGIYVGEYQNQSWVFVGEITSAPREVTSPLERSSSSSSSSSGHLASRETTSPALSVARVDCERERFQQGLPGGKDDQNI